MVSTACTMLSIYGAPISSTEAATRSHAPSVYVTPQNTAASDIISVDWSPVHTAPYTYWAVHNWNQGGEGGGYAGELNLRFTLEKLFEEPFNTAGYPEESAERKKRDAELLKAIKSFSHHGIVQILSQLDVAVINPVLQ